MGRILFIVFAITSLPGCSGSSPQERESPDDKRVAALRAIANNSTGTQAERAGAVFKLWANHLRPGSSSAEVRGVLADPTWLKETHLEGVRALGGWIPVEMSLEDSIFCLQLFPADRDEPWSPWAIFVRLSGTVQDAEALAFLRGESKSEDTKLLEFALCYPHSSLPRNRIGRIERYSQAGKHVYEE